MTEEQILDPVQSQAANMVAELLHLTDLNPAALFGLAAETLGASRSGLCVELTRLAPLSRRSMAVSTVATLILGTQALGESWWTTPHEQMVIEPDLRSIRWEDRGLPDSLLASSDGPTVEETRSTSLGILRDWISDDVANDRWGRPIDYVDLSDPRWKDRVILPASARPGERYVASFDPGHRIWIEVVEWNEPPEPEAERLGLRIGKIGSRLGISEIIDVSEVGWAWDIATDVGPIRLPGEAVGGPGDPFDAPIERSSSSQLYKWASVNGAEPALLGRPWTNKAEIWTARCRLRIAHRAGQWLDFERAVRAIVDSDADELRDALPSLNV